MKIKIGINDIIRDISSSFEETYFIIGEQYAQENKLNEVVYQVENELKVEKLQFADLTTTSLELVEIDDRDIIFSEEPPHIIDETGDTLNFLNLPGKNDEISLTTRYKFKNQEEYFYYLFSQMSFEIYGKAKLKYKEAMNNLNEFMFITKGKNKTSIFSQEINNARPSTLHFLSRERFVGQNIEFFVSLEDFWKDADVVITTSPYLLEEKPRKGKVTVKIETPYNLEYKSDFSFKTFKDFLEYYKNNNK